MSAKAPKKRFPRAVGEKVAAELLRDLGEFCERMVVAGSLRREKADVGDVEILFIPRIVEMKKPDDLFAETYAANLTDERVEGLIGAGVLEKRKNVKGSEMFGKKNKYLVHVASGLAVDLFATTAECWWNSLVCRTGSAASNQRIAYKAGCKGWTWKPYSQGFWREWEGKEEWHEVHCEKDVFDFVGLPFLEPKDRT